MAIITGHMALSQVRATGEQGYGMALAGTILGYANVGLIGLIVVIVIAAAVFSPHWAARVSRPGRPPPSRGSADRAR